MKNICDNWDLKDYSYINLTPDDSVSEEHRAWQGCPSVAVTKKGRLFACIDVTDPEPPVEDNALRSLDNVILTPHIAGTVSNGLKRIALHACEEIERLVSGEKMRTEVDLDSLSRLA